MKIECNDQTVNEILQSAYYEIPRFQRPYSWEKEHLEDFWKDVFKSDQKDYFIGSIVTYKSGDSRAVVDGQQRLTTLTILLSVLRNEFDAIGSQKQATGIHRLIERYDLEDSARFVLSTETSYPYLQFAIQSRTPDSKRAARGDEDELLKLAFAYMSKQVSDELSIARQTGIQKESAQKARMHKRIEQMRDTVLALKLILVQLDNEDDAYLVFETLNTRGKDLTTSDLLKNHLARLLRATNARGDSVRVKWLTVAENVKAIQLDDVSVDDFVYHYWLAKNDFTRARDIFKVAKKTITTRPVAKKTLDELESFSQVYRDLFRGNIRAWKNEELKIKRSIESIINRFRVRQPIPLLLTALSKYSERTLSKSELERLLFAVELFTFANTGLMGARSSGGILQMYSVHARELSRSNAPSRKEKTIDVLLRKLRDRLPSKESFVERFVMLRLSDTAIADKRLIQYSLLKLMEKIAPSVALDPALMSIEHIASQSSKDFDDDSISSIGNLWYLDAHFNTKLANKPWTEKRAAYQNANTPRDKYLAETDDWTPEVIRGRAIHLAELMWEIVDSSIA